MIYLKHLGKIFKVLTAYNYNNINFEFFYK